mmetsp:Transcript_30877/g.46881  ORF Transcript_30877/g.46881 Transcript_30877/m.46881 type:complete len:380 (-) Transcript_30877:103-1242(-)
MNKSAFNLKMNVSLFREPHHEYPSKITHANNNPKAQEEVGCGKQNDNENHQQQTNIKTKQLKALTYPITSEGYAESVDPTNEKEILGKLNQFGLVVVPVLSKQERLKTLEAFFQESNEQQRPVATQKLSLDPITWGDHNWPAKTHFLVRRRPTIGLEPTLVRTHPIVHQVFTTIFGTEKLQTSIDRWGVMRGTRNIPTQQKDGTFAEEDHPEWRQNLKLHWDMNPWAYNKGQRHQRYQALIAILDSPEQVGGFRAVPGSHQNYMEHWADGNEIPNNYNMTSYRSVKIAVDDPAQQLSQRIPIQAGDMIVFDSRLLHGTFPNNSSSMRLVQYVRMMPESLAKADVFSASNVLERHVSWQEKLESYPMNDRQRRLLGLKEY